jgi:hypothetical protein
MDEWVMDDDGFAAPPTTQLGERCAAMATGHEQLHSSSPNSNNNRGLQPSQLPSYALLAHVARYSLFAYPIARS